MTKLKFVKFLSIIVAFSGMLVIMGWIFDVGFLKSILPNLVAMKLSTAVCFVSSGLLLYALAKEREGQGSLFAQIFLPATSLLILLLMATFFISVIFGLNATGIDNIFVQEKAGAVNTFVPGRPSIPTMFNFILIATSGILTLSGSKKHLFWLGLAVLIVGGVAIAGYVVNQPVLYFLIVGKNTAMALNTAILFALVGVGFILCGKAKLKQN